MRVKKMMSADAAGQTSKVKKRANKDKNSVKNIGIGQSNTPEAQENVYLTHKEKKAWVNNYMQEHNCDKKTAKAAFKKEFFGMSRKEEKEWVKTYMQDNDCNKKEAKAAFEKEFGYDYHSVALGKSFVRAARGYLVGMATFGLGFVEMIRESIASGRKGDDAKTPVWNFVETGHFRKMDDAKEE